MQLRDYQQEGMDQIRQEFKNVEFGGGGRQAVLYVAPTGAGKTVVFAHIAALGEAKGNRVYILVHRQELIRQTSQKLVDLGVRHGIIWSKYQLSSDRVQVCSVQTMAKRLDRIRPADLLVIDEAHHSIAGSYLAIIKKWPGAKILGVTATPHRADGYGLDSVYESMVLGPTTAELIERGFLSPFRYFDPPMVADLSAVRKKGHDFNLEDLELAMDKPTITGDCIKYYIRYCFGKPGITFTVSRKHAEHVAMMYRSQGINAVALDGTASDSARLSIMSDYAKGVIKQLVTVDLVSEGFDVPNIVCASMLRPSESEGLVIQQIGRVIRPAPGKDCAFIFDHVGHRRKFGLPDQPRAWSLYGTRGLQKSGVVQRVAPVSQCPECYCSFSPAAVCPFCGHVMATGGRKIQEVEGELQEVTNINVVTSRKKEEGRAQTLEELIALGESRGYRYPKQWAKYKLEAREEKKKA